MNLNDVMLEVKEREEYGDSTEEILEFAKSIFEEDSAEFKSLEKAFIAIPEDHKFKDNSVEIENGNKVYFRNIEDKLVSEINCADIVLGAVAWLSSRKVIDALIKKDNVFIIVDKDPIFNVNTSKLNSYQLNKRRGLIREYGKIKCELNPYQFDNILNKIIDDSHPEIDPVKCVGKEKSIGSYSRMHNKFLLFAKLVEQSIDINGKAHARDVVKPYAVWTGSFNFTHNATQSLENALVLTDKEIVSAYFKEFGQIAAISEKLVWDSPHPNPDWKFT